MLNKDTYDAMIANSQHSKPFILTTPAEPPDQYMVCIPFVNANGDRTYDLRSERASPRPRSYSATTLLGLCTQVRALIEASVCTAAKVAVFVSRTQVCALLGEHERRDRVTFVPKVSEPLRLIKSSVPGDGGNGPDLVNLTQKNLIHILRREFDGRVDPPAFLPLVRQLKFSARTQGEGCVLGVGRESMGKSIEASLAGLESGQDLPEHIRLSGRVFENVTESMPGAEFDIACVLDADLAEQKFSIRPTAIDVEDCLQAAELGMGDFVRANTPKGVMVMDQSSAT